MLGLLLTELTVNHAVVIHFSFPGVIFNILKCTLLVYFNVGCDLIYFTTNRMLTVFMAEVRCYMVRC